MDNKELIKAFRQGGTGNCVSIAIIKAGIEIFGINNIFQHSWDNNICNVIMRDGFELEFTMEEMKKGAILSKFIPLENEDVLNYAILCYTAMAKRSQLEDNDNQSGMSFEEAAETLNKGEYYLEGPHWIGLRQNIRSIGRKYIWQYKGVIGASRSHCFFASKGYEDNHGKIDRISFTERRFCKWFRITEKSIH
ncbi:hypothetical protein [Winogradskyella bathintestinalis]|uniref:Uncharacterized protein n=1 Tax=Winogradskyella bathintestinalis TaxID=3035208 RepID=A0ABT7ZYX1_9FLAO|nr:hypothetical protein [Winogradskyella bathintestinalis]MDN3494191.1 hypothetical protein [Winogradskyella bathintestinalis]